uniref:Interleukin 13 receptor subunit alpha 1 n=1 Tax=Zosterops lateralis melanops TaxID=1220523 RepID=A0A8D2PBB3_ZOSLA
QLTMVSRIDDCYTGNSFLPGEKVLPSPSNLNYSFIQICTLNWTWNPPENISSGCNLWYSSEVINGYPEDGRNRFRVTDVHLNEEMHLRVRSECKNDSTSEPSSWVETSLLPKGIPGTAAVDLSCVWHNLEYMACTWRPGKNASSDTNYTLFYWFVGDFYSQTEKILQLTLSKTNDVIDVKWNESETFPENCLRYEVHKYSNGNLENIPVTSISFYNFCFPGEKKDSTIYVVLIITIPLIVAVSTIILLVYLKRLKILILPPIPDPREILKRMFGEQNEDSQVSKKLLGQQFHL